MNLMIPKENIMINKFKHYTLADLGTVITGKTPSTSNPSFWNGNIPFITPKDLQTTKHIIKTERTITDYGRDSIKGCILPKDSISVSCIGNLGYVGKTTKESVTNQQINSIIPNNLVDSDFLYYLLKSMWSYFKHYEGQSTALSILNKTQFEKIQVNIPEDIDVQKKIAGVLSALDDKIELNNQINSNLDQQAQALFKSWFIDFEPFGGKMPNDWEVIKFEKLANFIPGYSYKSSELSKSNCAMVTIKNFNRNGGFKIDGLKEILPSQKLKNEQKAKIFDILVAHTDLTQNAEIIGNAEMILNTGKYSELIFSMDLVKVSPKSNLSAFLILLLLKNKYFKSHCLGYVNGTTVLHLNKSALPEYKLAFPKNINCLNILNNVVENIYKNIAKNNNENQRLSEIRDSLLPKLMSGEIDVSKVDIEQIINNKD